MANIKELSDGRPDGWRAGQNSSDVGGFFGATPIDQPAATESLEMVLSSLGLRAAVGSDEQGTYSDPYGGFLVPESMSPDMLSESSDEEESYSDRERRQLKIKKKGTSSL